MLGLGGKTFGLIPAANPPMGAVFFMPVAMCCSRKS
jgi:hypothetical protein